MTPDESDKLVEMYLTEYPETTIRMSNLLGLLHEDTALSDDERDQLHAELEKVAADEACPPCPPARAQWRLPGGP